MDKSHLTGTKTPSLLLSVRFMVAIIIFFGYCFQYMLKINMSIAIVCMVNNTAINLQSKPTNLSIVNDTFRPSPDLVEQCPNTISQNDKKNVDGEFVWSKDIQGLILSGYFYGYLTSQIIGGVLSFKFGGKKVLAVSMFIASAFTIIIPFCARWSYIALLICRVIVGIAHGTFWPATASLWAYWAPSQEKAQLVGMAASGAWIGNIIALPLGGFLCSNQSSGGWASIFYIFGAGSFVWTAAFTFLTSETPKTHKFISELERDYILMNTPTQKKRKTPWLVFFTTKACIAIMVAHFFSNWTIYVFLTQLPSYLKDVLKYDIKKNGLISALPYIMSSLLNLSASIASNKIILSGYISKTNTRRLFAGIGFFVPMLAVVGLIFVTCMYPTLAIVLLIIGISFSAILWGAAHLVNINEVAGPYSGVFFGISNTLATIPGIIAPYITSVLTPNQSQKEWQNVFIICAVVSFIGGLFYIIFCDGNIQPWAVTNDQEKNEENKSKNEQEELEMDKYTRF